MHPSPAAEAAVARWIGGGVTSLTHPILALLFRECFAPLGIEADWFEAEPFSGLETGWPDGWLRRPRWNPAQIDSGHPAAEALQPWAAQPSAVTVRCDGLLQLPPSADESAAWVAIRSSVIARERARAFLAAAAASLLFDPEAAAIYCAGDAASFARRIWGQMAEPPEHKADAAANIPAPAKAEPRTLAAGPLPELPAAQTEDPPAIRG